MECVHKEALVTLQLSKIPSSFKSSHQSERVQIHNITLSTTKREIQSLYSISNYLLYSVPTSNLDSIISLFTQPETTARKIRNQNFNLPTKSPTSYTPNKTKQFPPQQQQQKQHHSTTHKRQPFQAMRINPFATNHVEKNHFPGLELLAFATPLKTQSKSNGPIVTQCINSGQFRIGYEHWCTSGHYTTYASYYQIWIGWWRIGHIQYNPNHCSIDSTRWG